MSTAVVDVNVLVSAAIISRGLPAQTLTRWQAQHFTFCTSDGILAELTEKLRSPRIATRYGITEDDVAALTTLPRIQATLVAVPPNQAHQVTGDPEDDYVLATCRLASADYLVTGDKGLLELARIIHRTPPDVILSAAKDLPHHPVGPGDPSLRSG